MGGNRARKRVMCARVAGVAEYLCEPPNKPTRLGIIASQRVRRPNIPKHALEALSHPCVLRIFSAPTFHHPYTAVNNLVTLVKPSLPLLYVCPRMVIDDPSPLQYPLLSKLSKDSKHDASADILVALLPSGVPSTKHP